MQTTKHYTLSILLCATALPVIALAQDDYPPLQVYSKDPSEERSAVYHYGDSPEHLGATFEASEDPDSPLAKRERVEQQVREGLNVMEHTEHHAHMESADTPEAFQALVNKAQQGDADAIGSVAYAYEQGLGTDKNLSQAVEWYKRAAEYGDSAAYSAIGMIYREQPGIEEEGVLGKLKGYLGSGAVQQDDKMAREWFERGMAAGDSRSFMELGVMYRDGLGGLPQDEEKAKWYYDKGIYLLERQEEKQTHELEAQLRERAELEEGLRQNPLLPQEDGTPQGVSHVTIDNVKCDLYATSMSVPQYDVVLEASCSGLQGKTVQQSTRVTGYNCTVQEAQGQGITHRLYCNLAGESFTIGSQQCELRRMPVTQGYNAVYGAYCGGAGASASVEQVEYMGMACSVRSYAQPVEGRAYVLYCVAPEEVQ